MTNANNYEIIENYRKFDSKLLIQNPCENFSQYYQENVGYYRVPAWKLACTYYYSKTVEYALYEIVKPLAIFNLNWYKAIEQHFRVGIEITYHSFFPVLIYDNYFQSFHKFGSEQGALILDMKSCQNYSFLHL